MIGDICLTIYETLKDLFISTPKTEEQWKSISNDFYKKLRIPKCLGSLTMKHMTFGKPPLRQSDNEDTLIITAIVDSHDNFIYANVEPNHSNSECIFESSNIKDLIETNQFNLPKQKLDMNNTESNVEASVSEPSSYYFVGHAALPLKPYLMNSLKYVPFAPDVSSLYRFASPEYEYCYAIENVEYNSESALRMLTNIFPILSVPFRIDSENARKITLGCIALYNFLRKTEKSFFQSSEKIKCEEECIIDDEEELQELEDNSPNISDSNCLKPLRKQSGHDASAETVRQVLIDYLYDVK